VLRTDTTPWRRAEGLAHAAVTFALLDRGRLDWYLATGEPFDKAGGYGIQGAGAALVSSMEGHPSTVVGLPVGLLLPLAEAVDAPLIP
jgi:septum formation protein